MYQLYQVRWKFHFHCTGMQKVCLGHMPFDCEREALECCDSTIRARFAGSKIVEASKESHTLLHWFKRKRVKRTDNSDKGGTILIHQEIRKDLSMEGREASAHSSKHCLGDH